MAVDLFPNMKRSASQGPRPTPGIRYLLFVIGHHHSAIAEWCSARRPAFFDVLARDFSKAERSMLNRPRCLPVSGSMFAPNLVAILTWSRKGSRASPTISSCREPLSIVGPGADKSSCLPQFCNPRGVTARKLSHETLLFCRIRLAVYGCDETLYSPTSVLVNLQTVPKIRSGERRASRSGFDKNIPKSWRNADATRTPGYCVPHEVRDFQRVLLIMCRKCIHLLRGEPCPRVEQLFRSVGTASHAAGMIGGII